MLSGGITDLHFHLFGSSFNFELSWLALMNNITGRKKDFSQIKNSKMPDANPWFGEAQLYLFALCIKVCAIRQLIFRVLIKEITENSDKLNKELQFYYQILQCKSEEELIIYTNELQEINKTLAFLHGKRYGKDVADYAIRHTFSDKNYEKDSYHNSILHGERWIMYKMFYAIFAERKFQSTLNLFFMLTLLLRQGLEKK